jgi:hypothetical protein
LAAHHCAGGGNATAHIGASGDVTHKRRGANCEKVVGARRTEGRDLIGPHYTRERGERSREENEFLGLHGKNRSNWVTNPYPREYSDFCLSLIGLDLHVQTFAGKGENS